MPSLTSILSSIPLSFKMSSSLPVAAGGRLHRRAGGVYFLSQRVMAGFPVGCLIFLNQTL